MYYCLLQSVTRIYSTLVSVKIECDWNESEVKPTTVFAPQPEVDAFKYSFIPRTIADWNELDEDTVAAATLDSFKKQLLH